jgi:hypothetical protein
MYDAGCPGVLWRRLRSMARTVSARGLPLGKKETGRLCVGGLGGEE